MLNNNFLSAIKIRCSKYLISIIIRSWINVRMSRLNQKILICCKVFISNCISSTVFLMIIKIHWIHSIRLRKSLIIFFNLKRCVMMLLIIVCKYCVRSIIISKLRINNEIMLRYFLIFENLALLSHPHYVSGAYFFMIRWKPILRSMWCCEFCYRCCCWHVV